jgi:hypothetical protein
MTGWHEDFGDSPSVEERYSEEEYFAYFHQDVVTPTERLLAEIKRRAKLFVEDNYRLPTRSDYLAVENAMLIGASIQAELDMSEDDNDRVSNTTTGRDQRTDWGVDGRGESPLDEAKLPF